MSIRAASISLTFGLAVAGAALASSANPAAASLSSNAHTWNGAGHHGSANKALSAGRAAAPVRVGELNVRSILLPDGRRLGSGTK